MWRWERSESTEYRRARLLAFAATAIALSLLAISQHPLPTSPGARLSSLGLARYCNVDELGVGTWERQEVDGHTWPRLKASVGYTCADNRYASVCVLHDPSQLDRIVAANSWRWQPTGCALRQFSPRLLVRRLADNARRDTKSRGILFVGDSLAQQQFQSFECLMGTQVDQGLVTDATVQSFTLAGGAGKIDFVRNDFIVQRNEGWLLLSPDEDEVEPDSTNQYLRKWTHLVGDKEFLVLNTGAHWGVQSNETLQHFSDMMDQVLAFLDGHLPHIKLIVRSLVPGHAECSQHTEPIPEDTPELHHLYNWQTFDVYNDMWKSALRDHPRHIYLDVAGTNLRGDGHREPNRDCLHYCLPGPPDTWNVLLNHVILGM